MDEHDWTDYEWDNNKRRQNLAKHGYDFIDAPLLKNNPRMLAKARIVEGEDRLLATGQINGFIVTMIYTMRANVVRIISLRSASRGEQKAYTALLGERARKPPS